MGLRIASLTLLTACSGLVVNEDGRPIDDPGAAPDGAVGTPCLPGDEADPAFPGFDRHYITIEYGNPMCGGGVCLVHGFQGRVSCPSGQAEGEGSCTAAAGEPVTAAVCAQCPARPARDAVHCSCRCAPLEGEDPEPGASYCSCPSDYSCEPLILVGEDRGGYCVKPRSEAFCGPIDGHWEPKCDGLPQ